MRYVALNRKLIGHISALGLRDLTRYYNVGTRF